MQTTDADGQPIGRIGPHIGLQAVLARVALEIDAAASVVSDFQDVLSPTLTDAYDRLPSSQLQGLDLLQQTLRDLGVVIASLASASTLSDQLDTAAILDRCKLKALAIRLGGGTNPPASRDIELF